MHYDKDFSDYENIYRLFWCAQNRKIITYSKNYKTEYYTYYYYNDDMRIIFSPYSEGLSNTKYELIIYVSNPSEYTYMTNLSNYTIYDSKKDDENKWLIDNDNIINRVLEYMDCIYLECDNIRRYEENILDINERKNNLKRQDEFNSLLKQF